MTCVWNPHLLPGVIRSKGNWKNQGAVVINIVLFLGGANTSSLTVWDVFPTVLINIKKNILIRWYRLAFRPSLMRHSKCEQVSHYWHHAFPVAKSRSRHHADEWVPTRIVYHQSLHIPIVLKIVSIDIWTNLNKPGLERRVEWQEARGRLLYEPMAFLLFCILQP